MTLDPATLLLVNVLIIALVSVIYGVVWLENRRERALLWMLGSCLLYGAGMVTRFHLPFLPALVVSNALVGSAILCIWMACRVLRGRAPMPWFFVLPLCGWTLAALLPGFTTALSLRIVAANCVIGSIFLLAAREVWLLPMDSRLLRLSIFALLAGQVTVNFIWAAYNLLFPASAGARILSIRGIAAFDIASIVFTLLLAIGLIILIRERALADYRRIALLDAVTGVENRRAFDAALDKAVRSAARKGGAISLVMVDIDSFKAYNDRYGHVEGDRCLHRIAQALAGAVPRAVGAGAFRYGGEEFAVLLPGMTLTEALTVTEGLRRAVRRLAIPHDSRESGIVTVSQGVAARTLGREAVAETAHGLLVAADQALYSAKRAGRDRVVAAGAAVAEPRIGLIAS